MEHTCKYVVPVYEFVWNEWFMIIILIHKGYSQIGSDVCMYIILKNEINKNAEQALFSYHWNLNLYFKYPFISVD